MIKERAQQIRDGVLNAYSTAAERPMDEHPFPIGKAFAESLGYPETLLDELPSVSVSAFAGVSNVAIFADISMGATVLDLGCGAGLDSLVAARRVGPAGKVIGIDFSEAMLTRAREGKAEAKADNVEFCFTDAERLPIEDDTVDVALINGIINLNTDRSEIFRELARVVRKGGVVYAAEIILREPLPKEVQESETNWFA